MPVELIACPKCKGQGSEYDKNKWRCLKCGHRFIYTAPPTEVVTSQPTSVVVEVVTTSPAPTVTSAKPVERRIKRLFLLAAVLAVAAVMYFQWRGPQLGWPDNLDKTMAQAKAQDRKVVVFLKSFPIGTMEKNMVETTLSKPENKAALEKGHFLLVQVKKNLSGDFARRYKIDVDTSMLVISPDGGSFYKAEGFIGEVPFRSDFLTARLSEKAAE